MLSTPTDNDAVPPYSAEVPLKAAAKLCGRSEKTLRRRIEADELRARQVPLEFGGFIWVVDIQSLLELFPEADELRQYVESTADSLQMDSGETRIKPVDGGPAQNAVHPPSIQSTTPITPQEQVFPTLQPTLEHAFGEGHAVPPPSSAGDGVSSAPSPSPAPVEATFFNYLLSENRTLKDEINERDARITRLQERAGEMERELGEQRGTSRTQAQVLEWFYQRYGPPELPPLRPAHEGVQVEASAGPNRTWFWVLLILLFTAASGGIGYLLIPRS